MDVDMSSRLTDSNRQVADVDCGVDVFRNPRCASLSGISTATSCSDTETHRRSKNQYIFSLEILGRSILARMKNLIRVFLLPVWQSRNGW